MPDTLAARPAQGHDSELAVLEMSFPADVRILSSLRGFLIGLLMDHGMDGDFAMDLQIAADEAITNVIEHAYGFDTRKTVGLRLAIHAHQVSLVLKDSGKALEAAPLSPLDLDGHVRSGKTSGLGRYMIESTMDSVVYERGREGNMLKLEKRRPARA